MGLPVGRMASLSSSLSSATTSISAKLATTMSTFRTMYTNTMARAQSGWQSITKNGQQQQAKNQLNQKRVDADLQKKVDLKSKAVEDDLKALGAKKNVTQDQIDAVCK